MSTEELLKPRYKVIAAYPEMAFRHFVSVGDMLTDNGRFETTRNQDGDARFTFQWELFPHLFKPLQWWEEREEKDLPQHVKSSGGKPYKVNEYAKYDFEVAFIQGDNNKNKRIKLRNFLPATLEEYNQYNQQGTKINR